MSAQRSGGMMIVLGLIVGGVGSMIMPLEAAAMVIMLGFFVVGTMRLSRQFSRARQMGVSVPPLLPNIKMPAFLKGLLDKSLRKLSRDRRLSPLVWLGCAAIVSILGFWYPLYVDRQFDHWADSRIGYIVGWAFPYLVAATICATWQLVRLARALWPFDVAGSVSFVFGIALWLLPSIATLALFGTVRI